MPQYSRTTGNGSWEYGTTFFSWYTLHGKNHNRKIVTVRHSKSYIKKIIDMKIFLLKHLYPSTFNIKYFFQNFVFFREDYGLQGISQNSSLLFWKLRVKHTRIRDFTSLHILICEMDTETLHRKWSFPSRISSVNMTNSALTKFLMENFIFVDNEVSSCHYIPWVFFSKPLAYFQKNFL